MKAIRKIGLIGSYGHGNSCLAEVSINTNQKLNSINKNIMKFISLNGWVEDSSFISLTIENGENNKSIGDQIWISKDGKEMQVYESSDKDVLQDAMNLFEHGSQLAFKGALRRMGVTF